MATVSAPARPRPAAAPPAPVERHGKCSLTLRIGGNEYRLRPMPPHGELTQIWTLRKLGSEPPSGPVAYAVAGNADGLQHCTCPDHEHNFTLCKHIMALRALGLIATPRPAPPARPRARTTRPARPAAPAVETPAPAPAPAINDRIPEGWQPGGKARPAPAPARGPVARAFGEAVSVEVRRKRGEPVPCAACGEPFRPADSGHPKLCPSCFAEEEGGSL